jgi:hypothetical protein
MTAYPESPFFRSASTTRSQGAGLWCCCQFKTHWVCTICRSALRPEGCVGSMGESLEEDLGVCIF